MAVEFDNLLANAKVSRWPRSVAKIAGGGVIVVGTLVLIGWMFDIAALKSVFPGLVTMKANTALGMLLCGGALPLLSGEKAAKPIRLSTALMATFVIALGRLTLGLSAWESFQ